MNNELLGLQLAAPGLGIALIVGVWYWAKKRKDKDR